MRIIKKVIVIDESAFIRGVISEIINKSNNLKVINRFKNAKDYIKQILKLKPDVIIVDLDKNEIDKIDVIMKEIVNEINAKLIVISGSSKAEFLKADDKKFYKDIKFILKTNDVIGDGLRDVRIQLLEYLEEWINGEDKKDEAKIIKKAVKEKKIDVVLIGASTGGPKALGKVLTEIKENINVPILIVQHMPVGFTKAFAERLNRICENFTVVEAQDGMNIEKNTIYIAKGGIHMEVSNDKKILFNDDRQIWGVKPAVDKLFISATKVYNGNVLACVLTGMGRDGADGIIEIKKIGGTTMAQSEESCLIYGMPKAAVDTGCVDHIVDVEKIGGKIEKIVMDK